MFGAEQRRHKVCGYQLVRIVRLSPKDEASKKKGDSSSPAGTQNDSPLENLSTNPLRGHGRPTKKNADTEVGQAFLWLRGYASVGQALLSDNENRRDACST